jgi:hypothetical protein
MEENGIEERTASVTSASGLHSNRFARIANPLGLALVVVLATGCSFLDGGYSGSLNSGSANPLAGRQAWTGAGSLRETVVDLSTLAGSQLWFRFRLGCDGSQGSDGWWVDDVRLVTTSDCGPLFADDFECGSCAMWSMVVGEQ